MHRSLKALATFCFCTLLCVLMAAGSNHNNTTRHADGSFSIPCADLPELTDEECADFQRRMGNPVITSIGVYEDGPDAGYWYVWGDHRNALDENDRHGQFGFLVGPPPLGPENWFEDFTEALSWFDVQAGMEIEMVDTTGISIIVDNGIEEPFPVVFFWDEPGAIDALNDLITNPVSMTMAECSVHAHDMCALDPATGYCKHWLQWSDGVYQCMFKCSYADNDCFGNNPNKIIAEETVFTIYQAD